LTGLRAIRHACDELFSRTHNKAFYNDWRWHAAVAEHLIPNGLFYLQLFREGSLVAIFPLQRRTQKILGFPLKTLSLLTDLHIVLSDVLVHREHLDSAILDAALRYLRDEVDFSWQLAWLRGFPTRSNLFAILTKNNGLGFTDDWALHHREIMSTA